MAEIFQRGVDVSRYQGQIDWNKVKAAGQQYAIVRAVSTRGSAPYVDPLFEQNIRQAAAAGLRVGVYYYTYATTEAQAIRELDSLLPQLEMIRQEGILPQYPIFVDVEDSSIAALGREQATRLALFAMNVLDQKGWYAGLYTYTFFAQNYLNMAELSGFPLFIADYRGYVGYEGPYEMWQFSSAGKVDGIAGNVDLSYSYVDFLPAIIAGGYNGFTPGPEMEPLTDARLEVFGEANTEYFTGPDVNQIAGRLPVGIYPALSRSMGSYNGFEWVTFQYQGAVWWTALLPDRTRLIVDTSCADQLALLQARIDEILAVTDSAAAQLRIIADELEQL